MSQKSKVEEVYEASGEKAMPTMLKFQNGSLAVVSKENLKYCMMRDRKTNAKKALVIASGQTYTGDIKDDELVDTYICVRNKSTNKMRIIPIETATLRNHIYEQKEKETVKKEKLDQSLITKKLLQEFGGRKASRIVADAEKMKISMDLVKDDLDKTIKETSLTEPVDRDNMKSHMELIAPKCNKHAESLDEIYDLNDLIPSELMDRLGEEAKAVYSTKVENLPISADYLKNLLLGIQSSRTTASEEDFRKIKIIIFMDCLYNLMKTRELVLYKIELSGITTKVEKDVRQRFGGPTGRRNKVGMEKALCYYIALALLLGDEYEIDANILAKDLEKPLPIITKFAQLANGMVKPKTSILKLRLPKDVPELKQKGRKRRTV